MFRKLNHFCVLFLLIALLLICGCAQEQEPLVQEPEPIDEESEGSIEDQEPVVEEIEETIEYEVAVIVSGTFRTDVGMGSVEKLFPDAQGTVSFSIEETIDAFSKYDYERNGSYITLEDGTKVSIFKIDLEDGTSQEAIAGEIVTGKIIEEWSKGKVLGYSVGNDGVFSVTETAGSALSVLVEPIDEVELVNTIVSWKIVDLKE